MTGWQDKPYRIEAKAGQTVSFCMCGKSQTGPLCDGSHQGTGIGPKTVTYDAPAVISACGCRRSGTVPICDGTHKAPAE